MFYLRHFPSALNPGRVRLRPLNEHSRKLTACLACNCLSARATVGSCGHSFCCDCALIRENNHLLCYLCKGMVKSSPIHITDLALEKMTFMCSCGVQGKLIELRTHLCDVNGHDIHDASAGAGVGVSSQLCTMEKAAQLATEIVDSQTQEFQNIYAILSDLKRQMGNLPDESAVVSTYFAHQPCKTRYFWFDIAKLVETHKTDPTYRDSLPFVAEGFHCEVYCTVNVRESRKYLGVYLRSVGESSMKEWPMMFRVCITLHRIGGFPEFSRDFETYATDSPIHDTFKTPFCSDGYGFPYFYQIDEIFKPSSNLQFEGRSYISLDLRGI